MDVAREGKGAAREGRQVSEEGKRHGRRSGRSAVVEVVASAWWASGEEGCAIYVLQVERTGVG